nr:MULTISPECIES: hypothetical protein [Paenibacillus]
MTLELLHDEQKIGKSACESVYLPDPKLRYLSVLDLLKKFEECGTLLDRVAGKTCVHKLLEDDFVFILAPVPDCFQLLLDAHPEF